MRHDLADAHHQVRFAQETMDSHRRSVERRSDLAQVLFIAPVMDHDWVMLRNVRAEFPFDLLGIHVGVSPRRNQNPDVLAPYAASLEPRRTDGSISLAGVWRVMSSARMRTRELGEASASSVGEATG